MMPSIQPAPSMYDYAMEAHRAGLCVLPPVKDGEKAPLSPGGTWAQYHKRLSEPNELVKWYLKEKRQDIGIVCGGISGSLEALDFDQPGIYDEWRQTVIDSGQGGLLERVEAGYLETTSKGHHLLYRCSDIASNQKLGVGIETRGEGGYLVIAPSEPRCLVSGGFDTIVTITPEERKILHDCAGIFAPEEVAPPKPILTPAPSIKAAGTRPGDDFSERTSWEEILEPHGWKVHSRVGDKTHWTKPGSQSGDVHATTNHSGNDTFYVFSTDAPPFDANQSYTKLGVFTLLNHAGDFKAAVVDLAADGYGDKQVEVVPWANGAEVIDIYKIMTRTEDLKKLDVKIDYIVQGMIPKKMVTILSAPSGMGKSTLLSQMCDAIVNGAEFMGLSTEKTPVVYLDYENPVPTIVDRFKKIGETPEGFHYWHQGLEIPLPMIDKPEFSLLKTLHPGTLIIIDTLRAAHHKEENSSTDMSWIMGQIQKIRDCGRDFTIAVAHHTGHNGQARGSTAIIGEADHNLVLRKIGKMGEDADDADDTRNYRLRQEGKTRAGLFSMELQFNPVTELFEIANTHLDEIQMVRDKISAYKESTGAWPNQSTIVESLKGCMGRCKTMNILKQGDKREWHIVKSDGKSNNKLKYELIRRSPWDAR